jgi:phosphoadenosine phosphosulfate reductase
MNDIDIKTANAELRESTPQAIIEWAISLGKKTIVTTNFGPYEAAILHMVTTVVPEIPVICIDTGYNTEATYRFAEKLIQNLGLNVYYYTPQVTAKRREVVYGGIPSVDDTEAHGTFTREVKLEPFSRAIADFKPEVWLTAIRKEQTAFRDSLDIVTIDNASNILKVAPLFYWKELDLEEYLVEHELPIEDDYFDPTKVLENRECGLHVNR